MPKFLFSDNGNATVAVAFGPAVTSITLATGTGALFPSPGVNEQFALTLNDLATRLIYEVVYCTARVGDVLTVIRAREGTTARTWQIGDYAFSGPTSGQMQAMVQMFEMLDGSISPEFDNLIALGSVSVAGTATVGFLDVGGSATIVSNATIGGGVFANSVTTAADIISTGGNVAAAGNLQATDYVLAGLNVQAGQDVIATRDVDAGRNVNAGGAVFGATVGAAGDIISNGGNVVASLGNVAAGVDVTANRNVFAAQDVQANRDVLAGRNVQAVGGVSGLTVASTNGNVTANNGRLRASFGAAGSGDNNAAALLGDFSLSAGNNLAAPDGTPVYWRWNTDPNGYMTETIAVKVPCGGGLLSTTVFVTQPFAHAILDTSISFAGATPPGADNPGSISVEPAPGLEAVAVQITTNFVTPGILGVIVVCRGY